MHPAPKKKFFFPPTHRLFFWDLNTCKNFEKISTTFFSFFFPLQHVCSIPPRAATDRAFNVPIGPRPHSNTRGHARYRSQSRPRAKPPPRRRPRKTKYRNKKNQVPKQKTRRKRGLSPVPHGRRKVQRQAKTLRHMQAPPGQSRSAPRHACPLCAHHPQHCHPDTHDHSVAFNHSASQAPHATFD